MKPDTVIENVPIELLYQALETGKGGVRLYVTALRCAVDKDLREEWNKYLEQTRNVRRPEPQKPKLLGSAYELPSLKSL